MNISDRIIATIRTGVPALIGYLLAQLIAAVPVVADVIAFLDKNLSELTLGVPLVHIIEAAAVAGVIALYYWTARKVGAKWPKLERYLLGSELTPVYAPVAITTPAGGAVLMSRREYRAYAEDRGIIADEK